jgi:hypothetical protein
MKKQKSKMYNTQDGTDLRIKIQITGIKLRIHLYLVN